MMPFHRKSNSFRWLIIAALALAMSIHSSALAIAAEPAAKAKPTKPPQANVTAEVPTRAAADWNRSRTFQKWNRSAMRPEPVPATSKTELSESPRIRHVSASVAEDGEVSAAVASESEPAGENVLDESEKSAPTSSLSVREQLLNALKKQREATVGASPSAIPGSLTIMNSPVAPAQRPVPAQHPEPIVEPAIPAPIEKPVDIHDVATDPVPPANAAKSHIGLTRTLEADLQSTDPYVRDRAQRYLRLEFQLLKLRANQASLAEHAAANADHHVPEPAVKHDPEPTSAEHLPAGPADHHELPDEHSSDHSLVHDSATAHSSEVAPLDSSHPLLMENVLVDGPIDRLGLANNLFATGEYPMALEMYQETAKSKLTAQQHFWVEYQTANCLRRLGKPTEASQRFRKLADHPEAGWISQQARWWVETLERIRLLEKTLADNAFDHHRATVEEVERAAQHVETPAVPPVASRSPNKEAAHDEHAH